MGPESGSQHGVEETGSGTEVGHSIGQRTKADDLWPLTLSYCSGGQKMIASEKITFPYSSMLRSKGFFPLSLSLSVLC